MGYSSWGHKESDATELLSTILCQLRWGREENAVVIPVNGKVFTYRNYERESWHQSIIKTLSQCRKVEMESGKLFL